MRSESQCKINPILIILKTPLFWNFFRPILIHFAAVHPPSEGVSELVFGDCSDDLVLNLSWDKEMPASSVFSHQQRKKACWADIWRIGQAADHVFAVIWSPGLRWQCGLQWQRWLWHRPCTENYPGTTIGDFLVWKSTGTLPETSWRRLRCWFCPRTSLRAAATATTASIVFLSFLSLTALMREFS